MKTSNSGRILMTPGVTVAPFSEAMPLHPQNGDEVIAVNVGLSTYTLTGSISGGDVEIAAGGSVILVYAGQFGWEVTWNSAGGGSVTYPTTVAHGGTGADLSGLDAGQLIAFDGPAFAGVDASILAVGPDTDVATNTLTLSATDSGANTSNVSAGIELPNSVGVAGDWVLRTGGTGASGSGTELIRALGAFPSVVINAPLADPGQYAPQFFALSVFQTGSSSAALLAVAQGGTAGVFKTVDSSGTTSVVQILGGADGMIPYAGPLLQFQSNQTGNPILEAFQSGDSVLWSSPLGISALFQTSDAAGGNANDTVSIKGNTAQTANLLGLYGTDGTTPVQQIGIAGDFLKNIVGSSLGTVAHASIGSGTDGTVNLVADAPGIAGNGFTVEVVAGIGLNVPMSAAFVLQALTVTLGTDGAGALDPTKNTATLVAGAINGEAGGVTATASGTGGDPLTSAEGPTTFSGGAESLTLAGGLSANANIYLTNLPGSDPGIAGALYQTAGAVMVSL